METPAKALRRQQRRVPDDRRKRAAQACARCKARKSKCISSVSGACQRCSRTGLICEYQRGEAAVPWDQISTSSSMRETRRSLAVPSEATGSPSASSLATDACQSERFMWPGFLSKLRESFSLEPLSNARDGMPEQTATQSSFEPKPRAAELEKLKQALGAFPQRSVADHLVTVLIEHGTDSFFYFDQATLISELDEFYANPDSALRGNTGFVCLALAAFALGSQWTALGTSPTFPPENAEEIGRTCYEQARLLIPELDDSLSLHSVQAPFILGVYLLPARATGSLHMYLGLALRKALALDLHVRAEDAPLTADEKEIRNRLWWAVFSLERTLTVKLNRPRSVDPSIITAPLPQPLQVLDSSQSFDNSVHQAANARLALILDRLPDSSSWTDGSGAAIEARTSLKSWKQSLSAALRLENISPASSSYRAVFHLHLNYYFAWIAMGKFKVVATARSRLRKASGTAQPAMEDCSAQLSKSCIKAAKKMLELFRNIDRADNMTKSSFTDFQGCSIATMILLVAGILERDLCYEARISFGLDCLRRMAGEHIAAINGVHFMEALKAIADEAAEKLRKYETSVERIASPISRPDTMLTRQDAELMRHPPADANISVPWTHARAPLQTLSLPPTNTLWTEQDGHAWALSGGVNSDPFSLLQFDNEAFLMELTELEMLGVSGS